MLLLQQGKSGIELGGAAVPCNFDRRMLYSLTNSLKICRTLTELRTTLFKLVTMRESSQAQTFG